MIKMFIFHSFFLSFFLSIYQIYPYSWLDSYEKLSMTELPPTSCFFNRLTNLPIDPREYEDLQALWTRLGFTSIRCLATTYLALDVLLLGAYTCVRVRVCTCMYLGLVLTHFYFSLPSADVFQQFRRTSLDAYGLDPLYFMTTPALAYASALRLTKIELEQISDPDMYLFMEQYKRGGFCGVNRRHAEVNHEDAPGYDPEKPVKLGFYFDANNLYGEKKVIKMSLCSCIEK